MNARRGDTGNMMFLILIAIALFGALTYAITKAMRGQPKVDREKAVITQARMDDMFAHAQQAVQRLVVNGNCTVAEVTFENSMYVRSAFSGGALIQPPGFNASAPVDKHCHLFDPAGGALVPEIIKDAIYPFQCPDSHVQSANPYMARHAIPGLGGAGEELIFVWPHPSPDMCRAFNTKRGLSSSLNAYNHNLFPIPGLPSYGPVNDAALPQNGITEWCFTDDGGDTGHLYIARVLHIQ